MMAMMMMFVAYEITNEPTSLPSRFAISRRKEESRVGLLLRDDSFRLPYFPSEQQQEDYDQCSYYLDFFLT